MQALGGELRHEVIVDVGDVVSSDSADFVTIRTGLGEDFVEVPRRDPLLINPVMEEDVEESAHDQLLPAASNAPVKRRPHH